MSVHYKFKSALDFDTVTFDGLHISVADLKTAISQQKRLGKTSDFNLQVTNAQTKEVYEDESALIPKNASLLIARVPLSQKPKKSRDFRKNDVERSNEVVTSKGASDLSLMEGTEQDKINAMISQSTVDYDPSNYQKVRGDQRGKVPPNYRCFRCYQGGHWISNCPKTASAASGENVDIKRSTGIPRSFMIPVKDPKAPGAMMTPNGVLAVPALDKEAYLASEETETTPSEPVQREIPDELVCSICKDIMIDAIMIPCCGDSFCDECIRNALLESEEHECPDCREKEILPTTLIPNRYLRNAVATFRNQTGYNRQLPHKPKPKIGPPQINEHANNTFRGLPPDAIMYSRPPGPQGGVQYLQPPTTAYGQPPLLAGQPLGQFVPGNVPIRGNYPPQNYPLRNGHPPGVRPPFQRSGFKGGHNHGRSADPLESFNRMMREKEDRARRRRRRRRSRSRSRSRSVERPQFPRSRSRSWSPRRRSPAPRTTSRPSRRRRETSLSPSRSPSPRRQRSPPYRSPLRRVSPPHRYPSSLDGHGSPVREAAYTPPRYESRDNGVSPPYKSPILEETLAVADPDSSPYYRGRFEESIYDDIPPPGTEPPVPGFEPFESRDGLPHLRAVDRERPYNNPPIVYREDYRGSPTPPYRDGPPSEPYRGLPLSTPYSSTNYRGPHSGYRENQPPYRETAHIHRDVPTNSYRDQPSFRSGDPYRGSSRGPYPEHHREIYKEESRDHHRDHRHREPTRRSNDDREKRREHRDRDEKRDREYRSKYDRESERYDERSDRHRDIDRRRDEREKELSLERRKRHSASPKRARSREKKTRKESPTNDEIEVRRETEKVEEKPSEEKHKHNKEKKIKEKKKKKKEKEVEKKKKKHRKDKTDKGMSTVEEDEEIHEQEEVSKPNNENGNQAISPEADKNQKTELEETTENVPFEENKNSSVEAEAHTESKNPDSDENIKENIFSENEEENAIDDMKNQNIFENKDFDEIEIHPAAEELALKGEVDNPIADHSDEMLANLPEPSRWEVDDDIIPAKDFEREPGEISSPEIDTKITDEVIKRAENAIFAKGSHSFKPSQVRSKDIPPEEDQRTPPEKSISNIQISVTQNIDNKDYKFRNNTPPKLSIKDRLGSKVDVVNRKDERFVLSSAPVRPRSKSPKPASTRRRITIEAKGKRIKEKINKPIPDKQMKVVDRIGLKERKKSVLDESNFEPDYETIETNSESLAIKQEEIKSVIEVKKVKSESESSSESDSSSSSSSSDAKRKKRKKRKKAKKKKAHRHSSDSDSDSDDSSSDEPKKKRKKHKKKSSKKKKKGKK